MHEEYNNQIKIAIFDEDGEKRSIGTLTFKEYEIGSGDATFIFNNLLYNKERLSAFFLDWIKLAEELNINLNQDFTKERQAMLNHLEDMRKLVFKTK